MCTVSPGGDCTHESRSNVPHEQQVRVGREGVHASPGAETWRPRHPRKPRQTAQPYEGTWLKPGNHVTSDNGTQLC